MPSSPPAVVSRMLPVRWGLWGVRPERLAPRLAYTVSAEGGAGMAGAPSSSSSSSSGLMNSSSDWLRGGGGGFGLPVNKRI